jgi:hypothetical protein
MLSGLELAFGLRDLTVNRLTCIEGIHSEDKQLGRMNITPPWEDSGLIPRFQEPVTVLFFVVFLVHPVTGYHTLFSHGVSSPSKNRLSYCFNGVPSTPRIPLSYSFLSVYRQSLKEPHIID